jgi:hypothetical protein
MLRLESVRARINKLVQKHVQEVEPWPPDVGSLAWAIYAANLREGIKMLPATQRPDEPVLLYLVRVGATEIFEKYPLDDPLDKTHEV